jgi:hypothetical protein
MSRALAHRWTSEHNRPKPALPQVLCDSHDAMVYVRP